MLCIVPNVGKLVDYREDSWFCNGGGGGLFGSVFGSIVWVLVVGYVICNGAKGYVIVGWGVWV
jgi:hypothetical protein